MMTNDTHTSAPRRRGDWRYLCAGIALVAAAAVALATSSGHAEGGAERSYTGKWLVEVESGGRVQLTFDFGEDGDHNMTSDTVSLAELRGLSADQARSDGTTVRFQIVRDAGTFECEGWFKGGKGAGTFTFVPDAGFAAKLQSLGYGAPTRDQQLLLALSNVGFELIEELRSEGYEGVTTDDLVRMGTHGVDLEYVRGLKAAGYTLKSASALVRMRDHGVDPEVIAELARLGYERLPAEQLVRVVDHGVRPDYIRGLAALGYRELAIEDLIRMRDHGVDPEYIEELRGVGLENVAAEDLVRMRDHGVDGEFVASAKARRGGNLTVDELVRMRDRGEE
jgi:hypothetical protein